MALTDPRDTLAYHQSRVLTTNRKMSQVPCSAVAKQISMYQVKEPHADTQPEREALAFYGMNHGIALIQSEYAPLEPLAPEDLAFVEAYYAAMAPMAVRAFNYLVLICTREARHNKSLTTDLPKISKKFGASVASFYNGIKGSEAGIHQKLLSNPPNASIGTYVKSLQWVFYNSKWSGGYGGPAWGAVADCLVRFVTGEFTAEMMLDTNWTLTHNNGPIFNKGMFYAVYTGSLVRILDIQRSGQIPEAILHDAQVQQFTTPEMKKHMSWIRDRFGSVGDYVDWYVVEALGAVHKYPHDKEAQLKAHGMSPMATAAQKKAKAAAIAKIAAEKKAKEVWEKSHFEIMPGLTVEKIMREAA